MIKDLMSLNEYSPLNEFQKIKFKFKKQGFDKLIIFDLDETLIHVKRDSAPNITEESFEPDIELPVFDPQTGFYIKALLSLRPFARQCLEFANKYFEVAIFTAGSQWFADPILDYLDPEGNLIQHRYFRQHTSLLGDSSEEFVHVKDLTILAGECDLTKTLIVDNNIFSFAFNLENGIPVHDYLGNKKDQALLSLIDYLDYIKDFENL